MRLQSALLLWAAAELWGQTAGVPASVYVLAPKSTFIWGETLRLQTMVRDTQGNLVANAPISWTVQPETAARVASDGTVTPLQLASFLVSAKAGQVTGQVYLQAIPKELTVVPDSATMVVGTTQQVRPLALDVNGAAIPNVKVQWQLTNQLGAWDPRTPLATIASDGTLKGLVAGRLRIVATIPYDNIPGFLRYAEGETTVLIKAPETYRFERVFTAHAGDSASLVGQASQVLVADDGSVAFVASFDGTSSALVRWKDGDLQPVLLEGRPDASTGQPLTQVAAVAVDNSGNWMVQEGGIGIRTQVSWGPMGSINPVLAPGSVFADAENSSAFTISRNSLNTTGGAVVLADYTQAGTRKSTTGLFTGVGSPARFLLANTLDGIPGVPGAPVSFTRAFGIADDGTVWFVATVAERAALVRADGSGNVRKVLAVGDTSPIGVLTNLSTSGDATNMNFFVSPSGDAIAAVAAGSTTAWLRWPGGDLGATPQVLQASTSGIYWHDPSVGTFVDTNYQGKGRGMYLWRDQATPVLLRGDTSLDGSPVTSIVSASCNSAGTIVAMVQTAKSPMLLVRLAPDRQVLLKAGDTFPIAAPPILTSFVPGVRSGQPVLIAGGQTGSIVSIDDQGHLIPLILLGSVLPGGQAFAGSNTSNAGFGQVHGTASGQVYFSDSGGTYLWSAGQVSTVVTAPTPAGGVNVGSPLGFDVNADGRLAGLYSSSGWAVYLLQDGAMQPVVTSASGVATSSGSWTAIDSTGAVAFLSPGGFDGTVMLWDGGAPRKILAVGDRMPDGRIVASLGWQLKSYSGGFVIWAAMDDGQYVYLRYRNGAWDTLIRAGDLIATGRPVNYVDWQWAVNGRGDLVFVSGGGGSVKDIVALRDGKYHEVYSLGDLTKDGDFLVALSGWHIQDDGTVYILAVTDSGQQALYRGTPN